MISNSTLHYTIIDYIIKKGYAPNKKELSNLLNEKEEEIEKKLYELEEYHGVVLHPKEPKIWVIHPFSLAPTSFLVKSNNKKWWGNCAWCSLGIATLIKGDVTITTTIGAYEEQIKIHIKDGIIQEKDLLVHFPIPMKKAWDNVIYTCSTMLVFKNEDEIDRWSKSHDIEKGDVQKIDKIWEFSKKWYGNHLDPKWTKWTKEEAKQIFKKFELNHKVWELEDSETRF